MKLLKKLWGNFCAFLYEKLSKTEYIGLNSLLDTEEMTKYHQTLAALRYLVIEEYYGMNNNGSELYIRTGNWKNPDEQNKDIQKFRDLIQSFENNGYDSNSPLYVDMNNNCFNGTHRLALCAWFGIETVTIKRIRRRIKVPASKELLSKYNLSNMDEDKLKAAYARMKKRMGKKEESERI